MSRSLPGEQVEHAFRSSRLCNWETPKDLTSLCNTTLKGTRFTTLNSRSSKTGFIVDERGHLLPDVPKINNAFNHPPDAPVYTKSVPRWPKANPTIPAYSNATMGYKGITTDYLPARTVTLQAVEVRGAKERNYNFL